MTRPQHTYGRWVIKILDILYEEEEGSIGNSSIYRLFIDFYEMTKVTVNK